MMCISLAQQKLREEQEPWQDDRVLAGGATYIDFRPTRALPALEARVRRRRRHADHGRRRDGGLFEGYQLKLNSYDLGVDIELADAVQRLRFEHPA